MKPTNVDATTVLKDRFVLAGAGAVLAILGVTGWLLFGGSGNEDKGKAKQSFSHMHCSTCQTELPYNAKMTGKECEYCEGKGKFIPTVGSIEEGSGESDSSATKIIVLVILAAVLLQAWAYLAVQRFRALSNAASRFRNRLLVCRCPFCKRKIGYPVVKAGEGLVCPRCKTAFTPVALDEQVEVGEPGA